ncbi:MAG: YWFCY domain-containing protein, partial [Bacteroidota bacterium]
MRKILDMTRLISLVVLGIHFYAACYGAFAEWHLVAPLSDRLLGNIYRTGLFSNFYKSKLMALGFLVIALIGVKGKKDEKQNFKTAVLYLLTGLFFFFTSYFALLVRGKVTVVASLYMGLLRNGIWWRLCRT